MKNSKLLLLLLLFTISCIKENDVQMDFKISGATPTTVIRGKSVDLTLKVFYLGGEPEEVEVSAEGVPQGVNISFDKTSGEPDYSINANISASLTAAAGTYAIKVKGMSASGKGNERILQLTVKDPANKYPSIVVAGYPTQYDTIVHILNDPFTAPSFYASDPEDGDLTAQVVVTSNVNQDYASLFTINYVVYDSDGDSAKTYRKVRVRNELDAMGITGNYSCFTVIQGGLGSFSWSTSISSSPYYNNELLLFKISDCYGLQLRAQVSGSNIYMPNQSQLGYNSAVAGHCDSATHTFAGSGTFTSLLPVVMQLNYTDIYEDTSGLQHLFTKTDTYTKLP